MNNAPSPVFSATAQAATIDAVRHTFDRLVVSGQIGGRQSCGHHLKAEFLQQRQASHQGAWA